MLQHGGENTVPVPAGGQFRGFHEQVALIAGVAHGFRHGGHSQTRQRPCGLPNTLAVITAHPGPLGHPRQLDTANGRLDLGEAAIGAEALMQPAVTGRVLALVDGFPAFAMVLIAPHPRPQRAVVGGDHAPFPAGGHDLVLAERPAAHMAETAHRPAAPGGAMGLGAVLDQIEAVLLGQRRHGVHVAGPAGQVHAHHRLGGRRQRRRHGLGGDVLAVPVHIREHRARAHIDDGRRGSQESA